MPFSFGTWAFNKVVPRDASEYEQIGDLGSNDNKIPKLVRGIILTSAVAAVAAVSLAMIIAPLAILSKEKKPDYSPLKYIAAVSAIYGVAAGAIGYIMWQMCKKHPSE